MHARSPTDVQETLCGMEWALSRGGQAGTGGGDPSDGRGGGPTVPAGSTATALKWGTSGHGGPTLRKAPGSTAQAA